jgi:DNA-binding MarR family transcriptional regulator
MGSENCQLKESLIYLVNRASRAIRKYLNQELMMKGYNVTGEQFDILVHLWNTDGQQQQRLGKTLYKDKSTMTRLIKSVEELKLVKRVPNKDDERQKLVYLTRSGEKIMRELANVAQKVLTKAQKGINAADLAICKDVLRKIHEALCKDLT